MPSDNVVDFTAYFNQKQKKGRLLELVSASGWDIDGEILDDSEVCVYLMDSKAPSIILFGCKKKDFAAIDIKDKVNWHDFVSSWDIIVDPALPFDETHKANTIDFLMKALPGIPVWPPVLERLLSFTDTKRPHILIIIDRDNTSDPTEIILARSESLVLNTASIQSIFENYRDGE